MNILTNKNKTKKFILTLVVLILFGFCCPQNVNADTWKDVKAIPANLMWLIEEGLMKFLNNIFTSDTYHAEYIGATKNEIPIRYLRVWLTPESIIKGKFVLLDANIFREIKADEATEYYDLEVENGQISGAVGEGRIALRKTISGWYYALRNFAIVALLSVLVYVGIRMIMTSVAQDKAKYKVMFKDWLVALCLLVIMHYFMIAILNISTMITESMGNSQGVDLVDILTEDILGIFASGDDGFFEDFGENITGLFGSEDKDYTYVSSSGEYLTLGDLYSKLIVFAGILIYTFIFAVKYLKREFTIIFLILLGPVSCITYPIDKVSDGKAQAFNRWFAEFLYQVIIQPFHLLLYIVLVGSAIQLAESNVIYALVCFAIIIPAEKFIKEMFGFKDRLGSPLGAFATGALASKAISSLFGKGKSSGSSGENGENNNSTPSELPPKTVQGIDGENEGAGNTPTLNPGGEPGGEPVAPSSVDIGEQTVDGQMDESDLTLGEAALGIGATSAAVDAIAPDSEITQQGGMLTGQPDDNRLSQSTWEKIKAIHNERASKKWGSTSRGQRWINRGKKLAGFAVRTAATGAGAVFGGALGIMTGRGAAGALAGAAIGRGLGNKTISGVTGVVNVAKDYSKAFNSYSQKEALALKEFKADRSQIDKAVLSYRKNHDGDEPNSIQLDREMEDRFALSRYNLTVEQIDRSVGSYQELRDRTNDTIALNQTVYAAKLSEDYSKKDFRSQKTMTEAYNTISVRFQTKGVSKPAADARAREYLTQAAKIKGTEISLPKVEIRTTSTVRSKTHKQYVDEVARKYKGYFEDDRKMEGAKDELIKELTRGGITQDSAMKAADAIIQDARELNG